MSKDRVTEHRVNKALHRANGPALIFNDSVFNDSDWDWYLFGKWHRYYGPADSNGTWFIHHVRVKC